MSIDEMVDLTNIGTLFAFVLVCVGITILRYKEPGRRRPFRVPFGAWPLPMMGAVSCLFLMYYLPPSSWWRFVAWLMLGLSVYLSHGYSRSRIGDGLGRPRSTPGWLALMALGSFALAVGLLTIPHDVRSTSGIMKSRRAFAGFSFIGTGIALGAAGAIAGRSAARRANPSRSRPPDAPAQ